MEKNKRVSRFFFSVCLIFILFPMSMQAQSTFLPSDLPGLKLWLKGDSVQQTTPPFVDKCYDNSSASNHALQATTANQPSSVSTILNGHKAIQFDGVDDFLKFNEIADCRTIFWVLKENQLATSNFRSLLGHSSAYDFVRGDSKQIWNYNYTNASIVNGTTKLNFKTVNGTVATVPAGHYSIISLVTTGNATAENFSNERSISQRIWDGELAELVIYNQPLTTAQVIQVETYLNNKYAPVVSLGPDLIFTNFCPKTLNTGTWFKSVLWSTGETTPSISINKSGTYWVKATDEFDRVSQDTIVATFPVINYSGANKLCPSSTLVWDTKYAKNRYTFLWQDNSTDSLFNITQPGKYYVKITDTVLNCSITSDTARIEWDSIANVISLGKDTSFCAGNSIGLVKGAGMVSSYLWSTGSTNSFIAVLTSGTYWVTVKSSNNCFATDTINVTITGTAPVPDFTFSNTCFKNITTFNDLSTSVNGDPIVSWSWNFGDLKTSILQNPTHLYADTGFYAIKLTIQTANCGASITKPLHLYPRPKADFSASDFFKSIPTVFKEKVITNGYSITQWNWNFGDPGSGGNNISNIQNPLHTYSAEGVYTVTLVAENIKGCRDTIFKTVVITEKPNLTGLPQLKVWLRADTLVTLNPDSTINSWKDSRGAYNFVSPSLSQSPLLKADLVTLNNLPYANFNGANGMLSQIPVKLRNKMTTVLIVGELNVATFYGFWVSYGVSSDGNWELFEVQNSGRLAFIHSFDNLGAGIDPSGSGSGGPAGNTTVLDKNPAIIMGTVNPSDAKWTINENFVNKHTAFSTPYSQATSALMSLGYRTDIFRYGNFKMAEMMVFDSTITTAEFAAVQKYLQGKYSKKVSLGADIAVSYGFCKSTLNAANPLFKSFKWSTGDTTKSISVNKTGTYSVDVTDIYGFHSYDTVKVVYPTVSSIGNPFLCKGTSMIWSVNLPKKGYTFKWPDNSTDSLITITQPGKYYVTIKDTLGCSITSDTLTIVLDNFADEVSLGADTTLCSGNTIRLKAGANKVKNYLWSTGSTDPTIPITTTGQYWVNLTSVNNCSAKDTISVVISGVAPTCDFSVNQVCLTNTTQFSDLSVPPSGETIVSWEWDFGDGSTSTNVNPTHVYADTGKYTIQLKVTTANGCASATTKNTFVYPKPKANFTSGALTCERSNIIFTDQTNATGSPITTWNWNFGDPGSGVLNTSVLRNSSHLFNTSGVYSVKLKVTNAKGCTDSISKTIDIKPSPKTDFSFSLACKDDTVSFKDLTVMPLGVSIASTYWNFGNATSNALNPINIFSSNVSYNVVHIVTASNGCKDTIAKKVDVHASPIARFVNSTSCAGGETVFTDQSIITAGSITSWKWTFDNIKFATVKNPVTSFSKAGNALVKQVVVSDFGCKDSLTKTIVVYPKPTALFTLTPEYGNPGQSVKFTNNSTNATTYIWDFADKSATSTLVNPTHIYKDTGIYHPMLVAVSSYGCKDTTKGKVTILKRFIDVAITGTKAQIQNGGGLLLNDYLNVHVDLVNKSTADIFTMDLYMETNDGPGVKETWTGKWLKGDVMSYDFKTTPSIKERGHFVCVYVLNPNGLADEVPVDNKLCNALDETEFQVLSPYPNPTEDLVVIPLIIPSKGELKVTIYNSEGKPVKMPYSETTAQGLQFLTIDAQGFNAGLYVCKIELDGKSSIVKFIKK